MLNNDNGKMILPLLEKSISGLVQGSVSRHGGVSRKPFASNNICFNVGDDEGKVLHNRERIKEEFGITCLVSARQVHGDEVFHLRGPVAGDCVINNCDALVTDQPGVGLMIGHADCQAVIIYDSENKVIAAVHSGWRGSTLNIIGKTVTAMQTEYGCRPENLQVGVGPSLGPCCSEFVNYREELPRSFWKHLVKDNHFDFWQITLQQLRQCGVLEEAIRFAGICTSCSVDYFSYRRACRLNEGITGRNGTVIAMVEKI